ncbi:hypothetical protein [Aliicoccus persicus]|uniref:hypothetical protein n=1 Tax=Aliicoccus persicus TaxID=930138 RepID=UPI001FDEDE48|nr:hypothetical protein [Aliicoccus persicus]
MEIRQLKEEDAEQFLELNKQLDDTGYMLYDPGERQMNVEEQRKANCSNEGRSIGPFPFGR